MRLGTQVSTSVSTWKNGAARFRAGYKIDICRAVDSYFVITRKSFINQLTTGSTPHVLPAFITFTLTEMTAGKLLVASFSASRVLMIPVSDVAYSRTRMSTWKSFSADFLTSSLRSGLEILMRNLRFYIPRVVLAI